MLEGLSERTGQEAQRAKWKAPENKMGSEAQQDITGERVQSWQGQ